MTKLELSLRCVWSSVVVIFTAYLVSTNIVGIETYFEIHFSPFARSMILMLAMIFMMWLSSRKAMKYFKEEIKRKHSQ